MSTDTAGGSAPESLDAHAAQTDPPLSTAPPRPRWGIRLHLTLAAILLAACALTIVLYSIRFAHSDRERRDDRNHRLESAVLALRRAFNECGELSDQLGALARAESPEGHRAETEAIATAMAAVRAPLDEIGLAVTRLDRTGDEAAGTPDDAAGPGGAQELLGRARRDTEGLGTAVQQLAAAAAKRIGADSAIKERLTRVERAQSVHLDALTRAQRAIYTLASHALAIDVPEAARRGRLEIRLNDVLSQEMTWVATVQDLIGNSRELATLVRRLLDAGDPKTLDRRSERVELTADRLDIYRHLPQTPDTSALVSTTAEYLASVRDQPSLIDLKRGQIAARQALDASLKSALAAVDRLSSTLYDLTRSMSELGRRLLDESRRAADRTQRLLQVSALIAGFLALGLVGWYIDVRVVRPLERLTQSMQVDTERLLTGRPPSSLAPESLAHAQRRSDEVGLMTDALNVLQQALADREQALVEHRDRLAQAAYHDSLTGLPNRALLSDRIEQEIARVRRSGGLLAVGLLDLDGFKAVNDTYGHEAGDRLLSAVTQTLQSALREHDTLARIGGDELALLLPDLLSAEDAGHILTRVLECFAEPFLLGDDLKVSTSASIGYTLYPQDQGPGDLLMRHADQAMYSAKRAGKARVHRYDASRDRVGDLRRLELERIERAFEEGELVVHYQPMVDLANGQVVGSEALLRWHTKTRGLLGPIELLRATSGSELAGRIGSWVLAEAVAQARAWRRSGIALTVSVNLGMEQILGGGFSDEIRALLGEDAGAIPPLLQLEFVESENPEEMARIAQAIGDCRAIGARVALDDFGSGYSSLTQLRRLPVHMIKIDRSFVRGVLGNREDRAIVAAVVALARSLDRDVLAEGVEGEAQGEALRALGCHLVQGYGIARPMPPSGIPQWLDRWRSGQRWANAGGTPGKPLASGPGPAPRGPGGGLH